MIKHKVIVVFLGITLNIQSMEQVIVPHFHTDHRLQSSVVEIEKESKLESAIKKEEQEVQQLLLSYLPLDLAKTVLLYYIDPLEEQSSELLLIKEFTSAEKLLQVKFIKSSHLTWLKILGERSSRLIVNIKNHNGILYDTEQNFYRTMSDYKQLNSVKPQKDTRLHTDGSFRIHNEKTKHVYVYKNVTAVAQLGSFLVLGHKEGTISIVDSKTGSRINMIQAHMSPIYYIATSLKDKQIATLSDNMVKLWHYTFELPEDFGKN